MKTYLPLILLLWLAACSSPAAQNASTQNTTQKPDTVATESEAQNSVTKENNTTKSAAPVSDTTKKEIIKGQIFLNTEGVTVPPYGLDKIKKLIAKIEVTSDEGDGGIETINEQAYNSLSIKEKFTYHMVHPETYSQICDPLPTHGDEANRIYGTLDDTYGEYDWSERQVNFFKSNRIEVAQLMKELIAKENKIENNFKEAIIEMNATELIPYLISLYNKDKKDHYILTVLLQLMKNNNYPEFVNSTGYKKLYKEPETADDYMHAKYLVYNKPNEDLIIQRATNFYNGLQAK
jgi:hypothetical protein